MSKNVKRIVMLLVILFALLPSCTKQKVANVPKVVSVENKYIDKKPKILIVYSYSEKDAWTASINDVLVKSFTEGNYPFEALYMNIVKTSDENLKLQAGAQAYDKYNAYKPDIILAVDDEAQKYFAKNLSGSNDVDIVFCGLEDDPAIYNYPNFNVTGTLERPQIWEAIRAVQLLSANVTSFTLLTDNSEESALFINNLQGMNMQIDIQSYVVNNFTDWKEKVNTTIKKGLIIYKYNKVSGTTPDELLKWTANNASIPSIAFDENAVKNGILLGKIGSGAEYANLAVRCVNMLAEGKRANQIPIFLGKEAFTYINQKTAAKLKLDASKIKDAKLF